MVVLLIVGLVFVGALAVLIPMNRGRSRRLAATSAVMQQFAAGNGWRFGHPDPQLSARAPHITELVGGLRIFLDFQIDGVLNGVSFQAFQVRRPPPRRSVSSYSPEYTAVVVPRPVPGPEVQLAPAGLSWFTALRRDLQVQDPAFDAAFHVSTELPPFALHLLRPPLTTWLAADARARQVVIVFEHTVLMAVAPGSVTPDALLALAGLMSDLHQRTPWPDLVR